MNKTIVNRGTGAGGCNTNLFGKKFEEKTNNQIRLLKCGYTKNGFTKKQKNVYDYYISKTFEDKTITFLLHNGFKSYMKHKYAIDVFRCPDEAYIIEYSNGNHVIKILEKKEQNVSGSVETKLWASPALKREYEKVLGDKFEVSYCLCVNSYLQNLLESSNKKYVILNEILRENKIDVLYGDDDNYNEMFDRWIEQRNQ